MGTRADFYIGIGSDAEWLGSIAFDGHFSTIRDHSRVLVATTEAEFREAVAEFESESHWTSPNQGWPWPWNTSETTDRAYAFHEGRVFVTSFGDGWRTVEQMEAHLAAYAVWEAAWQAAWEASKDFDEPEPTEPEGLPCEWPDMSARKNPSFGGPRDGLIVLTLK